MDEYIDIVSRSGAATGKVALKSEAHKHGWYHNTIHVWLYTATGKVLLQQRSHKKSIFPLLWDVSVAGHIDAGESFTDAALRETYEEIGLSLNATDLEKVGVVLHESEYDNGQIKDYEFHQVYIAALQVDLEALRPDPDEVENLKLVDLNEFLTLLTSSSSNGHFVATNSAYYKFVIKTIKDRITTGEK